MLFVETAKKATHYLEFGCGLSTQFVAENFNVKIRSVDTSKFWVEKYSKVLSDDVQLIHIDLGSTGDWGRPKSYDYREKFIQYFEAGFKGGFEPDMVFIDGRFRVACFLTSVLHARPGTRIIFDDYPGRPHYWVVEEFLRPTTVGPQQALFIRPGSIDIPGVTALRDQFAYVMD